MVAHHRCSMHDVKCDATVNYLEFHNLKDLIQLDFYEEHKTKRQAIFVYQPFLGQGEPADLLHYPC